jgi:hypothetical protein
VYGLEHDHDVGRLGLVRCELRRILIVPAGKVDDPSGRSSPLSELDRLHDIEPVSVKEERVIAEAPLQLGNYRVSSGMASASNWLRVRSTSGELNFIAHSSIRCPRIRSLRTFPLRRRTQTGINSAIAHRLT